MNLFDSDPEVTPDFNGVISNAVLLHMLTKGPSPLSWRCRIRMLFINEGGSAVYLDAPEATYVATSYFG